MHKNGDDVEWRTTRGNDSPWCHLKRTPASWSLIQKAQERNHAEAPTRLAKGWSRTYASAIPCATVSKQVGRYQRKQRAATAGVAVGATGQGAARRPRSMLLAYELQACSDSLSNNLLNCLRSVQRWCVNGAGVWRGVLPIVVSKSASGRAGC